MEDRDFLPEVVVAADWWADVMSRRIVQNNGDGFQSAVATYGRCMVEPFEEHEKAAFRSALLLELQAHVLSRGWEPSKSDPNWGSAARVVRVDYGPDIVLERAVTKAFNLTSDMRQSIARISLLWPIKTVMWINPGSVRVSHGHGAAPVTLYPHRAVDGGQDTSSETVQAEQPQENKSEFYGR